MVAVPGCCHFFSYVKQIILPLPEAFQRRNLRPTISLETSQQMQGQAKSNELNILGVDLQVLPTSILPLPGGLA